MEKFPPLFFPWCELTHAQHYLGNPMSLYQPFSRNSNVEFHFYRRSCHRQAHPQMPILTHHMSILYIPIRINPFTFLLLLHACIPNELNLIVFNCGFLNYPLYQSTGLNALVHSRHNQPLLSSLLPTHTKESTCIYTLNSLYLRLL